MLPYANYRVLEWQSLHECGHGVLRGLVSEKAQLLV